MSGDAPVESFDVLVVGAGHAGIEAAAAACSMGMRTCLITMHLETIAQMSCNPAVGGLAKGHLVREIDAMGGQMALLADEAGIQFRLLNRSRGGAVQAPRAQCDKTRYRLAAKRRLEQIPNLTLFQGIVREIAVDKRKAIGIRTLDGNYFPGKAVILTPGTFLNGMIHVGLASYQAGRANEPASIELGENLKKLGFKMLRLKTGTPMRLDRNSIDWTAFQPQPGDSVPVPFSFRTRKKLENLVTCYVGYTNAETHDLIRNNLKRSPLYSGKIKGIGPRYCPSIEDKVVKFPHHPRHQFFLEPEGIDTTEIYVNGLSSSLPLDVQKGILQTITGLDNAKIIRPAYGIEYDAACPTVLRPNLETALIENLFFAGQINGTSGYEEAAAQGLMAGINAVLKIKKKKPFVLRRDEAYIGVLIDDLIHRGVEEPYRLFTARAEHRLYLRIDNADARLSGYGRKFGTLNEKDFEDYQAKEERIQRFFHYLSKETIKNEKNERVTLRELLRKPEIKLENMVEWCKFPFGLSDEEARRIESEVKYEGYIKKQDKEIYRIRKTERMKIPVTIDFSRVPGLTREAVEKLTRRMPGTLGEAQKISGITPANIFNLYLFLRILDKQKKTDVSRGTSRGDE